MSEKTNRRPIFVGLFILIGLSFLVAGVLIVGGMHSTFSRKISVTTVMDDIQGLQPGNNIWFSGVKVGTVHKIEFMKNSTVRVDMRINRESQPYIHKTSFVKVGTDGLIGNRILIIYGGNTSLPHIEDGDVLITRKSISTQDIMNTFEENNQNILKLTKKLADSEGTIGKLLNSDEVYIDIASTIKSFQAAADEARQAITSLNKFSNRLNKEGTLVNDITTDTSTYAVLKNSVNKLEHTMDTLKTFVSKLKKNYQNTKSPLGVLMNDEKTAENIKSTISNLESSSKKLDQDLEGLQHSFLLKRYFKKEEKKKKSAKQHNAH